MTRCSKNGYEEALLYRDEALESVGKLEIELQTASALSEILVKQEIMIKNIKREATEGCLTLKEEMKEETIELKKKYKALESVLNENTVQLRDFNAEIKKLEVVSVVVPQPSHTSSARI